MNLFARFFGFRLLADRVLRILFGQRFLCDPARAAEREWWRKHLLQNDRAGLYRAVEAVCARDGVEHLLEKIVVPTLVIVGDADIATPVEVAQRIHAGIAGSQLVSIPQAGHSATIEEPVAVNAAIAAFLDSLRANGGESMRSNELEARNANG
jgi:pimeloyl-ACP methyl ester carboxylesterase